MLEAKREDKDPYEAKEQARGYAENVRAPFVILSNGNEHWFWNYERRDQQDAYRIERLPSREDLERVRLKNMQPPRPLLMEYLDKYSAEERRRHDVPPGVTGWAQVNGLRGDTSIEERIKYDLYYIENWSLAFDIKILLRTVKAALMAKEIH